MQSGDQNTEFFHGSATKRKRKFFIKDLKDVNGVWHEDVDTFLGFLNDYYSRLFFSSHPHDFDRIFYGVD